jgi:DNA-binding GntR family transcriptional regulator
MSFNPKNRVMAMAKPSPNVSLVRPVDTATAAELVIKEIRRAIITGSLRPEQTFSLRQIAAQLNVSFIPVREALRALESEGLIVGRPGRSAMVAPLSGEDLHSIYRLRRQIEPEIASRSCLLLTHQDYNQLSSLVQAFADPQKSMDEIYDAHHEFHVTLLRPAATPWDLRTLAVLWHAAERYARLAFDPVDAEPKGRERRATAHGRLISEFRARDPQRAAEAQLEYLQDNEITARSALKAVIDENTARY